MLFKVIVFKFVIKLFFFVFEIGDKIFLILCRLFCVFVIVCLFVVIVEFYVGEESKIKKNIF